jgi:hypothetical protein
VSFSTSNRRPEEPKPLDRDESEKEKKIRNPMTSRTFAPKAGERNKLFSRDPSLTDSAKWTTRDKDLTLSDDPTF